MPSVQGASQFCHPPIDRIALLVSLCVQIFLFVGLHVIISTECVCLYVRLEAEWDDTHTHKYILHKYGAKMCLNGTMQTKNETVTAHETCTLPPLEAYQREKKSRVQRNPSNEIFSIAIAQNSWAEVSSMSMSMGMRRVFALVPTTTHWRYDAIFR